MIELEERVGFVPNVPKKEKAAHEEEDLPGIGITVNEVPAKDKKDDEKLG